MAFTYITSIFRLFFTKLPSERDLHRRSETNWTPMSDYTGRPVQRLDEIYMTPEKIERLRRQVLSIKF